LLLDFPLEYAIRKIQENQKGLKLNGTYQLLFYDDNINILGKNTNTTNRNIETILDASGEVGLVIKA
jgi:hypothetical protein